MRPSDELELALRRLADDLASMRNALAELYLVMVDPPDPGERRAA